MGHPSRGFRHVLGDAAAHPDDLDRFDGRVRPPARRHGFSPRRVGDEGVEIVVGNAPGGPRPVDEVQIDARLARPEPHRRRRDRPFAGRTRRASRRRRGNGARRGGRSGAHRTRRLDRGRGVRRRRGRRRSASERGRRGRRRRARRFRRRSRRLGRVFRRQGGGGVGQPRRVDAEQLRADRKDVADRAAERHDRACDRRRDLDRGLVGHHRGDGLVLAHGVAELHMPFDDLGLGHPLADVGHLDRAQAHVRPPSP